MTTQFEKREVTRLASIDERADLTSRLLEILSSIDSTREEAKAAASEYRSIITDLHKREIGLRFNLQTGTVTQEIDVHAVADEATGMMQYFDREGNEVVELRHELSQKQKDQTALQRQIDMFGDDSKQDIQDLASAFGNTDIFNTSPAGSATKDLLSALDSMDSVDGTNPTETDGEFAPRTWAIGDLCQTPEGERFILLFKSISHDDAAEVITESGNILTVMLTDIHGEKRASGLNDYIYVTHEQVLADFAAGYFVQFFEVSSGQLDMSVDEGETDNRIGGPTATHTETTTAEADPQQTGSATFDPAELDTLSGTTQTDTATVASKPLRVNGRFVKKQTA